MPTLEEACKAVTPGYGPFRLDNEQRSALVKQIQAARDLLASAEYALISAQPADVREHRSIVFDATHRVTAAVEVATQAREALREASELMANDESTEREARIIVAGDERP